MSHVYLVRHGQAGTRDEYDSLSDLGRAQARLLGEYFVSQGLHFAAAYAGGMSRQQQTAGGVSAAYSAAGLAFPQVSVEPGWSEFNLDQVYRGIAPRLCAEDEEFRQQYEEMREQVRANRGAHGAEVHRQWLPCDTKIVDTWISGQYEFAGESWKAFHRRVAQCRFSMNNGERNANVLVFTSAMPTAIWTALSLGIEDERVMGLAGVVLNTSYSLLRLRGEELRLFTFNAAPHLVSPEMRTYR